MRSPKENAKKWKNGTIAGIDRSIKGVINLKDAPARKLLTAKEIMLNNWTNSVNDGTWAKKLLSKAPLQKWKKDTVEGWEKNRNVDQSTIELMERYYGNLDQVISKLDILTDMIVNRDAPIMEPNNINKMMIKQNLSSALTKFQRELLHENSFTVIFETIKDYMITKLGYSVYPPVASYSDVLYDLTFNGLFTYQSQGVLLSSSNPDHYFTSTAEAVGEIFAEDQRYTFEIEGNLKKFTILLNSRNRGFVFPPFPKLSIAFSHNNIAIAVDWSSVYNEIDPLSNSHHTVRFWMDSGNAVIEVDDVIIFETPCDLGVSNWYPVFTAFDAFGLLTTKRGIRD